MMMESTIRFAIETTIINKNQVCLFDSIILKHTKMNMFNN